MDAQGRLNLTQQLLCVNNSKSFTNSTNPLCQLLACVRRSPFNTRYLIECTHLAHPLQTMSFFHLPSSSASAFDVRCPGACGIQSWGIKRSGSSPSLLGGGFPLILPCVSLNHSLHHSLHIVLHRVPPPQTPVRPFTSIHYRRLSSSCRMRLIIVHVVLPTIPTPLVPH